LPLTAYAGVLYGLKQMHLGETLQFFGIELSVNFLEQHHH